MAEQPVPVQNAGTRLPFPQGQFNLPLTAPCPSALVQRFLLLPHGSARVLLQCSHSYEGREASKWVSSWHLEICLCCAGGQGP